MTKEPKIYITHDKDGMHLWFSLLPPRRDRNGCFHNKVAGGKIRLPLSWFGEELRRGECREISIADVLCQAKAMKN